METHGNHRRMVSKWSIPTRNGCGNDTCWKNKAPPDGSAPKSDSKYLSMRAAAPALSDLPQLHELIQDSVQAAGPTPVRASRYRSKTSFINPKLAPVSKRQFRSADLPPIHCRSFKHCALF